MRVTRIITAISLLPLLLLMVLFAFLLYQFRVIDRHRADAAKAAEILQRATELVYLTDRYIVTTERSIWPRVTGKVNTVRALAVGAKPSSGSEAASGFRKLELDCEHLEKLLRRFNESNTNLDTSPSPLQQSLHASLQRNIIVKTRNLVSTAQLLSQEKAAMLGAARQDATAGVVSALLVLAVTVPAVTVPISRKLSRSLTRLREGISRSSLEELKPVDDPATYVEFSEIAAAFNSMVAKLQNSFHDIERRKEDLQALNETLNTKVLERTKELSEANLLLDQMRKHSDAMSRSVRREAAKHQEESRRIRRLTECTGRILGGKDMEDTLKEVTAAAQDILDARYAVVGHGYFHDEIAAGRSGRTPCPLEGKFRMANGGVYLDVLETGRVVRLTQKELFEHPAWWGLPQKHAELRGLLAAPLRDEQEKPFAVLMVTDRSDGGDFTDEDEKLLVHLASVASAAITLTRINRQRNEAGDAG